MLQVTRLKECHCTSCDALWYIGIDEPDPEDCPSCTGNSSWAHNPTNTPKVDNNVADTD